VLRDALENFLTADPMNAAPAGPRQDVPGAALPRAAVPDSNQANATPRSSVTPPAAPPPPYRGAPLAAQPTAAPSVAADTAPQEIGKVLFNETDAALARQTLMQAASLPDQLVPGARNDASGPRWLFEVPFATPQGTTVAQFEIARDGKNAPAAANAKA